MVSKKETRAKELRATVSMLSTQTDRTSRRGASIISESNVSRMSYRQGEFQNMRQSPRHQDKQVSKQKGK